MFSRIAAFIFGAHHLVLLLKEQEARATEIQLRRLERIQHEGDERRAMILEGVTLDENIRRMKESEAKVDDHIRRLREEYGQFKYSKGKKILQYFQRRKLRQSLQ